MPINCPKCKQRRAVYRRDVPTEVPRCRCDTRACRCTPLVTNKFNMFSIIASTFMKPSEPNCPSCGRAILRADIFTRVYNCTSTCTRLICKICSKHTKEHDYSRCTCNYDADVQAALDRFKYIYQASLQYCNVPTSLDRRRIGNPHTITFYGCDKCVSEDNRQTWFTEHSVDGWHSSWK